ncbi:MAG: type II secretion system protein N [Gammaproteobacteria bacterium]|jgi:hypothetical protein
MKRGAWILIGLAMLWVTANLPAGLIRFFIDEQQLTVVAPKGTLWAGSATLVSHLGLQGQIEWQASLFQSANPQPGLDLRITDNASDLRARAQINFSTAQVAVSGTLAASSLQPLLERYDLFLTGHFTLSDSLWTLQSDGFRAEIPATLRWSGGPVRYILANTLYTATMPPLDAQISSIEPGQLNAAVFFAEGASGDSSPVPSDPPLLLMRLMQPGSVYIGVSRGLLRAANFPWQGNEDEGDLIFEIERSLATYR